jgi:hypothetical protein
MNISKNIIIIVVVGIVLLIILIVYSLSPTQNDVSNEPILKPFLNKPITLKQTGYILKVEKGQYDLLEHLLVTDKEYPGEMILELPIGSTIIINKFKTYTNNLGSGFTRLYAIGDIVNENSEKIYFEYSLGIVEKELYSNETYKLNFTVWQDSSDLQINLTKK